jgi:hypothetical protein
MRRILLTLLLVACALPARSHEFWLLPDRFALAAPGDIDLALAVGENFQGETVGFSSALLAQFQHISRAGRVDLRPQVGPEGVAPSWRLALPRPGTHLVAITTHPSEIELPADKFNEYLRTEGLDAVLRQRERSGRLQAPGRERYRRHIKTLVQVGAAGDATYGQRTGQRLELVPRSDPARARSGAALGFELLFDGRPLAGALVKFWKRGEPVRLLTARSDRQGRVAFAPPQPGTWMASVVHMVPVTDSPAHDWDSFWGNLTFALPAP